MGDGSIGRFFLVRDGSIGKKLYCELVLIGVGSIGRWFFWDLIFCERVLLGDRSIVTYF